MIQMIIGDFAEQIYTQHLIDSFVAQSKLFNCFTPATDVYKLAIQFNCNTAGALSCEPVSNAIWPANLLSNSNCLRFIAFLDE